MRKVSIISCFFFVFACFVACKKPGKSAPAKFTGCRISQISESGADTSQKTVYHLYYNNDGSVSYMFVFFSQSNYSNYYKYFNRIGTRIISRTVNAQQNYTQQSDTISLDAQGRVDGIIPSYYSYGYDNNRDEYYYDSVGNMYLHNAIGYSNVSSDFIPWLNGDPTMDSLSENGGEINVTHYWYNDTLYNTGNLTARLSDLENYGRAIYTPKHLMNRAHYSDMYLDSVKTFNYLLDTGGRITTITESLPGTVVNISRIVYECE